MRPDAIENHWPERAKALARTSPRFVLSTGGPQRTRGEYMRRVFIFLSLVMTLALTAPQIRGQEGHPLVGSWHGDWGTSGSADRMDLTLIIDWDGSALTGLVNPVTDRAALENARLNSGDWTVSFEVTVLDRSGTTRRCMANGALDKLGSDRRELAGSWSCGDIQADFHITRDRDY